VLAEDITRIRFVFYFIVRFSTVLFLYLYVHTYIRIRINLFILFASSGSVDGNADVPPSPSCLTSERFCLPTPKRRCQVGLLLLLLFLSPLSPAQSYPVFSVNTGPDNVRRSRADYPDKFPSSGERTGPATIVFLSTLVRHEAHGRPGHGLGAALCVRTTSKWTRTTALMWLCEGNAASSREKFDKTENVQIDGKFLRSDRTEQN